MRQQYFAPGIFPEDASWGARTAHPVRAVARREDPEDPSPVEPPVRAAAPQADMKPKPRRASRAAGSGRNRRTTPAAPRFKRGPMPGGEPIVLVVKYRRDGPWSHGTPQE
jgi:hypothetical protein